MYVTIAMAVLAIIAMVFIMAAFKPDVFRMQRKATMNAEPEKIFPCINDFHNWASWSPFEKLDPNMKKTFSGAASGRGAIYAWEGNSKAGSGRMEIVDESAPDKVVIQLDFLKPFEAHNVCEFTITRRGTSTEVTWAMHGRTPFMAKVMHVFVNMDKMLGKDFEEGLAKLKTVTEK